jgi:hypothetical protein
MTELSAPERDEWFLRQFGATGDHALIERKDAGFTVELIDGHRPGSTTEYRTAHHVKPLPRGRSAGEYERQLDKLTRWSRDLDRKLEALTDD